MNMIARRKKKFIEINIFQVFMVFTFSLICLDCGDKHRNTKTKIIFIRVEENFNGNLSSTISLKILSQGFSLLMIAT